MEDVSPALRDQMSAAFLRKREADPEIKAFRRKLEAKTATQADAAAYAERLGQLARDAIRETLTPEALPNETLYFNILQNTVDILFRNAHGLVNQAAAETQKAIDEAQGIGLNAVPGPYPERRARDLLYKAGAQAYQEAMKTLGEPVVNLTQSFHDEFIRTNAETRFKAGMAPQIVRTAAGKCCGWCDALAGRYDYEDVRDTGNDVFRRHERCRCVVEFITDGKRQDVWSKKIFGADEETLRQRGEYKTGAGDISPETLAARAAYGLEAGEASPATLAARAEYGLEKELANGGEHDIIKSDDQALHTLSDPMVEFMGAAEDSHPEEIKRMAEHVKEIGATLIRPDSERLEYQPGIIKGEPGRVIISKGASYSAWVHEIKHMDDDYAEGWEGMRILSDPKKRARREWDAYEKEIKLAQQINRPEAVERLEVLRDEEIRRIRMGTNSE